MKDLIAKRYVKALASSASRQEIEDFAKILGKLASANTISKFGEIIESPYIDKSRKVDFILNTILENQASAKFANFIKILAEHKRLDLFDELYVELSSYLASLNKEYIAYLIVNEGYSEDILKEIESKFAKRLGVNLSLKQKITAGTGIKLMVEDLGVEVSFSQEKFINDLRSHILRAF